ncbi:SRPBCC family protein [Flaviflagellibacter deserti]|jgi:uncharacterized protein YndB with AHSA1/START domain|uniref:SRPBCC family protein n=1 Tax=Flaviflagellibacter deserti TaxID=2267266 RepID=A0ABV9Z4B1_9HYPH
MTDYATALAEDTVRLERYLPGPIERVWAYLTESDKRATWLARGEMDLRPGGRIELTWQNSKLSTNDDPPPEKYRANETHTMVGEIIECDPPRLLSFTWGGEPGDSWASFELTPKGDSVHLVITHRRLANRGMKVGVSGGWHAHLDVLEDVLNGEPPRAFWRNYSKLNAEYEQRL